VRGILMSPKKAEEMKRAANKVAARNAAEKIADLVVKEAK